MTDEGKLHLITARGLGVSGQFAQRLGADFCAPAGGADRAP